MLRLQVAQHYASLVPETGLVADVRLIQLDTEEDAQAAKARLEEGEDFAIVAAEMSTDATTKDEGGSLGWITLGQVTSRYGQDFERVAFNMDIGTTSEPELSNNKYYIIQVVDRNPDGRLPEEVLVNRQNNALDEWLTEQLESDQVEVERNLTPDDIPPDPLAADAP
jgi:parvulin-like peptidyl-prolyl isomerase